MHLALDELLKKSKEFRRQLLQIRKLLPDELTFDRLLVLVCMGKGGFLPLVALPNHATMELICKSTELFEEILPYLDQQFIYNCMDEGTKSEIMQSINTIRHSNISKTVRDEHYYKALTILFQVIYETISPSNNLWEEFTYRLVAHWNTVNREFIQSIQQQI
ncbi:hypothetical protein [Desulfofalx alkaliphila]|uniref:hypothetical protein n=1 Tax=Desulfofalx alkaliphila TaxID=105483 RepID=UPI0004E1FF76|nr:hypothetical protein [Desulfofalx alkaliphila]